MNAHRSTLVHRIETLRKSRCLIYVTGDRPGLETKISSEVHDLFTHHLDAIGDTDRISLFLYTRGGETLAAWSIANLVRQFCKELEVIVPAKAHSAGTLMCLAANRIIMTKQATLGPIDPSVNMPLNPSLQGAPPGVRIPVSVEDVSGFVEFARSVSDDAENLRQALQALANKVHPLVLGSAFRARSQIQMLARKLMSNQCKDDAVVERILRFLCSESGSHDYTINRREATEELGLAIEKPDDTLYESIKSLYDDIAEELQLGERFDPGIVLGVANAIDYTCSRAIIESIPGGSHTFVSQGRMTRVNLTTPQGPQVAINDQRNYEGWRHSNAASV